MTITSNISTVNVTSTGEPSIIWSCCKRYCSFAVGIFRWANNLWACTSDTTCGNTFTCSDGSSICKINKYADNTGGWEWNNPANNPPGWKYPHVTGNISDYRIGNITNCTTQITRQYYKDPTGAWVNLAYDIYIYPSSTPNFKGFNLNFMVWFEHTGNYDPQQRNPPVYVEPIYGTYVATINDGYNNYKVYRRVGRYPGEDPPIGWYVFISQGPRQSTYNFDMKKIFDFMKTMPATITRPSDGKTAKGNITNDDWLNHLMLGTEFINGEGKIRISRWNIRVNNDEYNIT